MARRTCKADKAGQPLRVLVVADDPNEALWIEHLFATATILASISRVPTLDDARATSAERHFDVVLFALRCTGADWTETCRGVATASGHGPVAMLEANDVLDPREAIAGRVGSAFYKEQITPETINRILQLTNGPRHRGAGGGRVDGAAPIPPLGFGTEFDGLGTTRTSTSDFDASLCTRRKAKSRKESLQPAHQRHL